MKYGLNGRSSMDGLTDLSFPLYVHVGAGLPCLRKGFSSRCVLLEAIMSIRDTWHRCALLGPLGAFGAFGAIYTIVAEGFFFFHLFANLWILVATEHSRSKCLRRLHTENGDSGVCRGAIPTGHHSRKKTRA